MATGNGLGQGKTAFLEQFLPGNRDADEAAINEAWRAAGNEGTVSESLISKIRSRLKIPKTRKATGGEDGGPKPGGKAGPKRARAEATSKAEEAPPQPNGRAVEAGPSKSAFVAEMLARDPGANLKAVTEAWASAGHEGTISPSIYYKVKRERGATGEPSPVAPATLGASEAELAGAGPVVVVIEEALQAPEAWSAATAMATGLEPGPAGAMGRVVDVVEAGIDELIFTLKVNGGMPEVEAALRAARRLLVRSQEG